jgi:hypothetical protein
MSCSLNNTMATKQAMQRQQQIQAKQHKSKQTMQATAIKELVEVLFKGLPNKHEIYNLLRDGRTSVVIDTCTFPKKVNGQFIFPKELTHRFGVPAWYLYQGFPSDDYNGRIQLSPSTLPGGQTVVQLLNQRIVSKWGKGTPVVKVAEFTDDGVRRLQVYLTWTSEWAQRVCAPTV